jgi:transcriptional regulator with XRE-family HTH domain
MDDFKTTVRRIMKTRGYDDAALAARSGVARETIVRVLNSPDLTRVRPTTLRKLANGLGMTVPDLVAMAMPADDPPATLQAGISSLQILGAFDAMTPEDQRMMLRELAARAARAQGRSAASIYEELAAAAVRELTRARGATPQTPVRGHRDRQAG